MLFAMKITTLCYPVRDGQVLLGMKKRGFGMGKWNGPGGKVEAGETPIAACIREVREEVGLDALTLEDRGIIEFLWEEKPEWNTECHIFVATQFEGEPVETEELLSKWFPIPDVPYADMWDDDPVWLPRVLSGGNVSLRFYFDSENRMIRHEPLA